MQMPMEAVMEMPMEAATEKPIEAAIECLLTRFELALTKKH